MTEQLIQIRAPHFTAGVVAKRRSDGYFYVAEAAPILRWSTGRRLGHFADWCLTKQWEVRTISAPT